jgi:2-methylisocitrate lyase-like PEP mutase family enzyme
MTSSTPPGTSPQVVEFRRLHESGCFVMPNPWDIGSARMLVSLGFPAIATTSAGLAWSVGRRDNEISLEVSLAHLRAIAGCVGVPVNADFEDGFAIEPEGVAATVTAATATGIAGVSIEDSSGNKAAPLYDFALAVERIKAARRAIGGSGTGVLLTARSEGFIAGRPDLAETIRRLEAYAEAGADCLYAPGIRSAADVAAIVRAVVPKPVNVLVGGDYFTVAQLADIGVRRISVGGALARAAFSGFLAAAREMVEQGTFTALSRTISVPELNALFSSIGRHDAC